MSIWQHIGDIFLDQGGGVDEKRVLGVPILLTAVVYVCITGNLAVFAALAGLGTLLLGIGAAGDQGKLGGGASSTQDNPTQGVPS